MDKEFAASVCDTFMDTSIRFDQIWKYSYHREITFKFIPGDFEKMMTEFIFVVHILELFQSIHPLQ